MAIPMTSPSSSPPTPSLSTSPSATQSAPSRRKRSSPTASLKGTLTTISSSSVAYPVPPSISWLDQLTLTLTLDQQAKGDAVYVLTVDHPKSNSSWHHARSFDDYRAFQHRLLTALQHGHFCHAECPWLYTFIRSYFPNPCFVSHVLARKQVKAQRREILQQCLLTLQSFLSTRSNHCCSVLTSAVADEVVALINGHDGTEYQLRHSATTVLTACPLSDDGSSIQQNSYESNSDDSYDNVHDARDVSDASSYDDELVCGLCHAHLADEAHSPSSQSAANEIQPASPVVSIITSTIHTSSKGSSTKSVRSVRRSTHYYTTRLA